MSQSGISVCCPLFSVAIPAKNTTRCSFVCQFQVACWLLVCFQNGSQFSLPREIKYWNATYPARKGSGCRYLLCKSKWPNCSRRRIWDSCDLIFCTGPFSTLIYSGWTVVHPASSRSRHPLWVGQQLSPARCLPPTYSCILAMELQAASDCGGKCGLLLVVWEVTTSKKKKIERETAIIIKSLSKNIMGILIRLIPNVMVLFNVLWKTYGEGRKVKHFFACLATKW